MIYSLKEFLNIIYNTQEGNTDFDFIKFKELLKQKENNNK
jgi:hypothetical protein